MPMASSTRLRTVSLCRPRPISTRPSGICQSPLRPGTWQWSSAAQIEAVLLETERPRSTSSWKPMSASEPAPRILHTADIINTGSSYLSRDAQVAYQGRHPRDIACRPCCFESAEPRHHRPLRPARRSSGLQTWPSGAPIQSAGCLRCLNRVPSVTCVCTVGQCFVLAAYSW